MKKLGLAVLGLGILLASCKKDPKVVTPPNEEEVITTLVYTLTPNGGGAVKTFKFQDLDGDGGNAAVITVDTLDANTTYTGAITLSNEQESPAEDITAEVRAEDDEHQFFFSTTTSGVTISYSDQDGAGNPIGLASQLQTAAAGMGDLTIILRHEPNKTATGVSGGDITNAGGETDIEVTFHLHVQ